MRNVVKEFVLIFVTIIFGEYHPNGENDTFNNIILYSEQYIFFCLI